MKKIIVCVCVVLFAFSVNADLLVNGDFETEGSSASLSEYWDGQNGGTVIASAQWGAQQRVNWGPGWSGGIHDPGYFTVFEGWSGGSAGIWSQVSGVTGGDQYELTGWFKKESNFAADSYLCKIDWYDNTTNLIAGQTAYIDLTAVGGSTNWQDCTSGNLTAPGSATIAQVVFEAVNMTAGGAFVGDDLQLNAIPEPTAVALIAIGGISLALYRRKRK